MQIENIIKKVVEIAQKYQKKLENKNILFIYINRTNQKIEYIETRFLARNFLHLTGLNFLGKYSNYFYKLCINNKLKSKDIQIKNKKIIEMKLQVLNDLVSIDTKSKMIGNFNDSKLKLNTEIVVGNINWCLGFIKENKYYVPNTLFKEDIRDMVMISNQIICIMSKHIKQKKYTNVNYLVKGFKIQDIFNSEILNDKINLEYDKNP